MARAELFELMPLRFRPMWLRNGIGASHQMNDNLDTVTIIFQAPEEDQITHAGIYVGGVRTPCPAYRISLRSVKDNGQPADTIISSAIFTPDATWSAKFNWIQLLTPYRVHRGQLLCLHIEYSTGTIGNANNVTIGHSTQSTGQTYGHYTFPYSMTNQTILHPGQAIYGLKSLIRSYGFPVTAFGTQTVNYSSEWGLRFWMHPGWGSTFKVAGIHMICAQVMGLRDTTWNVKLYGITGELQDVNFRCNIVYDISNPCCVNLYFAEPIVNLEFGVEYFIVISPNQINTNFKGYYCDVGSIFDMTAMPGGIPFYTVERASVTDPWTRYKTRRPAIDLIIEDWTSPEAS